MAPRLLLTCFEVPGVGGSSTASYDLFARMQRDGLNAQYLNLIAEEPAYLACTFGKTLGNPAGLPGVHNFWLDQPESLPHPALERLIREIAPDIVLAFGFPATLFLKRNVPEVRTVLMTGSCRQATAHVTSGRADDAMDLMSRLSRSDRIRRTLIHSERLAVERADLIVTHSALTLDFMRHFYPASVGRIYPRTVSYAEWIHEAAMVHAHLARPFSERDIDALFISNDWDRREKNYRMVEAIARLLPGRAVHIVGDAPRKARNSVHHGFIADRREVFEIAGRARCIVSPSLIDAAPGILFEGAALGCNLIASRNCGNHEVCHPELVVSRYDARHFADAIDKAITRKFDDNMGEALARSSYDDLIALVSAFARPFATRGVA